MAALKTVTVRLPEGLHREVKVRAARRGDSLEGIARAAFVAYLDRDESEPGSVLERAGVSARGLGAGEPESAGRTSPRPVSDGAAGSVPDQIAAVVPAGSGGKLVSPAPSSFRPDPKVKK